MATSVKLDAQLKERIQRLAELKNRSSHWIMCEAIQQYVVNEEAREAFKQEALDSWQHYQETGLHATADEVSDWLKTWGTDNKRKKPKCHD